MDKWVIRPDPSPFDPRRHVLLLKGDMKDISAILRKFGAQCGRPAPTTTPEGYNYSLVLHAITQVGLERISSSLNEMTNGAALPPSAPPPIAPPSFAPPPITPPGIEPPGLQPPSGLQEPPPVMPPGLEPPGLQPPSGLPEPPPISPPGLEPPGGLQEPPAIMPPEMPSLQPPGLQPPPSLQPPGFEPAIEGAENVPPKSFEPPPTMKLPTPPETPPAFVAPPSEGLGAPDMDKNALPSDPSQLKDKTPPPVPELVSLAPASPPPAELPPPGEPPPSLPPTPAPTPAPELASLAPAEPPPAELPPSLPPTPAPDVLLTPPPAAPVGGPPVLQTMPNRPMWGIPIALNPECTFDTLLVGPYNRFAHAAATSVVGSPGSMYNPLFLYGAAGVGKTHAAFAIAHGLVATLTADGVIMTSGARLARAASDTVAEGRFAELEQYLSSRKALIVDDIHLLAVTEANRAQLSRVFELFFSKGLQVVLTSIYPPKALGALEEALKINLGKGWSVDLKVPGANVQTELLQAYFDKQALETNNEVTKIFHERIVGSYGEWKRWAKRLRNLVQLMPGTKIEDMMPVLFTPGVPQGDPEFPTPEQLTAAAGAAGAALSPGADALNLAVLTPKGHEGMGPWAVTQLAAAAKQFNFAPNYRLVLMDSYDAGQPFGVPFQIGDACLRAGAQAALIIGPPADSGLAPRVGEFSHAVGHVLEGVDAAMGWMPHNGTTSLHQFLRAHLDFMARGT